MKNNEFDEMVTLMYSIAWHVSGQATHQPRAGSLEEEIEQMRTLMVDEED